MVVSQNFSSATSLAMLAPISTLMVMPSFSWITSEMSLSPSGPSSTPCRSDGLKDHVAQHTALTEPVTWSEQRRRNKSQTLMREIPSASLLTLPFTVSHTLPMNWCGITKTKMSASLDASTRSGTASWETWGWWCYTKKTYKEAWCSMWNNFNLI